MLRSTFITTIRTTRTLFSTTHLTTMSKAKQQADAKNVPAAWLMKTEPDEFSIDDLKRDKKTDWSGCRNYQVRNFMRAMKHGERVLIYHSNTSPPGVVGMGRISKEAFADDTQFDPKSKYYDSSSTKADPRWVAVEVEFVEKFKEKVDLDKLKEILTPEEAPVVAKGNRLSVSPVHTASAVAKILAAAKSDHAAGLSLKAPGGKTKKAEAVRRDREE